MDIAAGLPVVLDDGRQYVYGAGLVSQVDGSDTYYYLADGLGSTMKTIDASGNVVNAYTYDVYGEVTSASGSQDNEFDFAGQQTDPTGLQYLRARYYDPETGSFLSRDPLAAKPAWLESPYLYAGANSANLMDPTGLCSWRVYDCVDDVWGGAVAGAAAAGQAIANGAGWTAVRVTAIARGAAAIGAGAVGMLASSANALTRAAWYSIRAQVNAQLSALALGVAATQGLACRQLRNGLTGCFGAGFLAGSALTIGNVVFVREKEIEDDLLDHEEAHANQWAYFGLSTPSNPLIGQSVMAASYGGFNLLFGSCGNPYEQDAGLEKGNYNC